MSSWWAPASWDSRTPRDPSAAGPVRLSSFDRDDAAGRSVGAQLRPRRSHRAGGPRVAPRTRRAASAGSSSGEQAGFWVGETGAVVVARADDEHAVLEELAAERGDEVVLLDPAGVCERAPCR